MRTTMLAAAVLSAVAAASQAADLGSLTVFSHVGEPLRAQLEIKDVDASASPKVRLAPASLYARVGKESVVPVSDMVVKLQSKDPYLVLISSRNAVKDNSFPLIIELADDNKRSAKLYNVVLRSAPMAKLPSVQEQAAAQTRAEKPAPQAAFTAGVPSAASATAATVPSAAPKSAVPSVQPAAKPAAEPVRETVQEAAQKKLESVHSAPRAAVRGEAKSEPAAKPVAKPAADTSPLTTADTIRVKAGMTMWSIAKRYKANYPEATMDQLLVAFVRDNPKAFDGGRVNGQRAGAVLKAPKKSTVAKIGIDEAWTLVRVTPNADARKAPSEKNLARAHRRMQKEAPALYREIEPQIKAKAAQAAKARAEREAKALEAKREAERRAAEAARLEEQKKAEAAAAAQAAAPRPDPLAETIAATTNAPTAAAAGAAAAASSAPASETAAPETPAPLASDAAPAAEPAAPAPDAKSEDEGGMSPMLIAVIVMLVAVFGAAAMFLRERNRRRRAADEEALRTVRFMKAEPASPEQLEAAGEMVANRMEADRAAARGFTDEVKAFEADLEQRKTTAAAEPVVPQPQVEAPAEGTPAEPAMQTPERREPSFGAPAQRASSSGFNVAKAFVDEGAGFAQAPGARPVNRRTAEEKLMTARNYMGVGAFDQALRYLNEARAEGDGEITAQCDELIARIREQKGLS